MSSPLDPKLTPERLAKFEEKLGYSFQDKNLCILALSHSSACKSGMESNERLEFLGDSILGFLIAMYIYDSHPHLTEGDLTKIRARVVSKPALVEAALSLGLGSFLVVGKGLVLSKKIPPTILANGVEALIGAVFLDRGIDAAWAFVVRHFFRFLKGKPSTLSLLLGDNNKSLLQAFAQKENGISPQYQTMKEEGPDHAKVFSVIVRVLGIDYGPAQGNTRKEAEQKAAKIALSALTKADIKDGNPG